PDLGVDFELVDRWIIAAEAQDARFVLIANKSDKPEFTAFLTRLESIRKLGYPIVAMSAQRSIAPLAPLLQNARTVMVGQSGMGKSTILNAIIPGAQAKTAEISEALAAGRHTTSQSTLYLLGESAEEGWIVDSPGLKVFGLAHIDPDALADAFVEI